MSGTTVLINCFEVFSPAQDQEEKVLCDFCVIIKKKKTNQNTQMLMGNIF